MAASAEDAEREEVAGFGEEESGELAREAEVAVVGGVLVESGIADEFRSGERDGAVGGGRRGGAAGKGEEGFGKFGMGEAKVRAAEAGKRGNGDG